MRNTTVGNYQPSKSYVAAFVSNSFTQPVVLYQLATTDGTSLVNDQTPAASTAWTMTFRGTSCLLVVVATEILVP